MRTMNYSLRLVTALIVSLALSACAVRADTPQSAPYRAELEYLKEVNRTGPPHDPESLFLLMQQFGNANRRLEGIEFLSSRLNEFAPQLNDQQKALYLGMIAILRAGHASEVPLLKRLGWVNDTINMLNEAKRLAGDDVFAVHWISGVIYAQLPGFFNKRGDAKVDLNWCLAHAERAPHAGWLREVHRRIAIISKSEGDEVAAREHLRLSGYRAFDQPIVLTTPLSVDAERGHTFTPKAIKEIVKGKVYALSGFEFTEYYFVVSDNGKDLIGIDAGTRPDSAKTAYEAFRAFAPSAPPLSHVLITHSHWDHVGGHTYYRGLNPAIKFYARSNFGDELKKSLKVAPTTFSYFFGSRYNAASVTSFRPDVVIERPIVLNIGGTDIEIIPIEGGETDDGMLINLPQQRVMFAGDFIMPYLGAPFVPEGNLEGLFSAIDVVVQKNPRHILHGHAPLTRIFNQPALLAHMKQHLTWLQEHVVSSIRSGASRSEIHRMNLIPPALLTDFDAHVAYLVMRENVINRLYEQNTGYWKPDLDGVDTIGNAERGAILVDYLRLSDRDMAAAIRRTIDDGQYEYAAAILRWTKGRWADVAVEKSLERLTYLKLKEKYQEFNPFKFIIYSQQIGDETPQMATPD